MVEKYKQTWFDYLISDISYKSYYKLIRNKYKMTLLKNESRQLEITPEQLNFFPYHCIFVLETIFQGDLRQF